MTHHAPHRAARGATLLGRHGRTLFLVILALAAGLGIGRFVAYDDAPQALAAAPSDPAARLASLEREVADRPNDLRAWQALGTAYVQQAIATGDPELFGLARDALDEADAIEPDHVGTLIPRGTLALTVHHFDAALDLGQRAHAADPLAADALAVIVDAQVELGRYDEAAGTLQKLLDRRPSLAALSRVSYLRQLHGDLPGALTAIRQAEVAGSGSAADVAAVTAIRGDLHLLRGDLGAADGAYRQALRLSPDLIAGTVGRARVLVARGEAREARQLLEASLATSPHPSAAQLLGEIALAAGRAADAAVPLDLVRELQQDEVDAGGVIDLEIALFEADHGAPATALHHARIAYDERRTVFTADALAWALHLSGDSAGAVPYAREALALGSVIPSLHVHSAVVLAAAGAQQEAATLLAALAADGPVLSPTLAAQAADLADRLGVATPRVWPTPPGS